MMMHISVLDFALIDWRGVLGQCYFGYHGIHAAWYGVQVRDLNCGNVVEPRILARITKGAPCSATIELDEEACNFFDNLYCDHALFLLVLDVSHSRSSVAWISHPPWLNLGTRSVDRVPIHDPNHHLTTLTSRPYSQRRKHRLSPRTRSD